MVLVSNTSKENVIVSGKFMIVMVFAVVTYVKINAVFVVVQELITLNIIVIASVIRWIVTMFAEVKL